MQTSARRAGKYAKKVTARILPGQAKNYLGIANDQAKVAIEVKRMCGGTVQAYMQVYYINFANEILKKARAFSGATLCDEVQILRAKHAARNADTALLDDIIQYYAPSCYVIPSEVCRFDVGRFDVNVFG